MTVASGYSHLTTTWQGHSPYSRLSEEWKGGNGEILFWPQLILTKMNRTETFRKTFLI